MIDDQWSSGFGFLDSAGGQGSAAVCEFRVWQRTWKGKRHRFPPPRAYIRVYVHIYTDLISTPPPSPRRYRFSPESAGACSREWKTNTQQCRRCGEDENSNMADRVAAAALGTDQKKNPIKPRGPPRHDGLAPLPRGARYFIRYIYIQKKKNVIKKDLLRTCTVYTIGSTTYE